MKTTLVVTVTLALMQAGLAQAPSSRACLPCIKAHEGFLASDALGGRGSGTRDEWIAAAYIASELKQYGVLPGFESNGDASTGELGRYIQTASVIFKKSGAMTTHNVVGILPGADPKLRDQIVLLSAHLDHLGTLPEKAVKGDAIYNGADDDASGVTAVLELARALAAGPRPKRTLMFAFFGSEEPDPFTLGSKYFLEHLTFPLKRIVINLEFEMIGRPDPAVAPHTLWLTGYDYSDLGPELARHGARLVADPHPKQQFFKRSDNYVLVKQGVIAQTISSFGLHPQYHKPDDDVAHLDFEHMADAIGSLIGPVRWLANSSFMPQWNKRFTADAAGSED